MGTGTRARQLLAKAPRPAGHRQELGKGQDRAFPRVSEGARPCRPALAPDGWHNLKPPGLHFIAASLGSTSQWPTTSLHTLQGQPHQAGNGPLPPALDWACPAHEHILPLGPCHSSLRPALRAP